MSTVLKLPISNKWKEARDKRAKLYNNPAWYDGRSWVRDNIQQYWEELTFIMRQEENKAGVSARLKYRLPT